MKLFNDDHHSVTEVALQIQKAIRCDPQRAWQIMMQAHNTGSAVVIAASLERCELVAGILEQIGFEMSSAIKADKGSGMEKICLKKLKKLLKQS